jgi:hypothetical protein
VASALRVIHGETLPHFGEFVKSPSALRQGSLSAGWREIGLTRGFAGVKLGGSNG